MSERTDGRISGLAYLALTREAKHEAARETLQLAATTLRKLGTMDVHCPELVNAAAKVEAVFDGLFLPAQVVDTYQSHFVSCPNAARHRKARAVSVTDGHWKEIDE